MSLAGYERGRTGRCAGDRRPAGRARSRRIRHHQKRVELAFRHRRPRRCSRRTLGWARRWRGPAPRTRRMAVFRRVAEHDPANAAPGRLAALTHPVAAAGRHRRRPPPAVAAPIRVGRAAAGASTARRHPGPGRAASRRRRRRRRLRRPRRDDHRRPGHGHPHAGRPAGAAGRRRAARVPGDARAFKRGIEENIDAEDYQRTTTSASRSRRWACWTRRSPNSRRRCARPTGRLRTSEALGIASTRRASSPSRRRSSAGRWRAYGGDEAKIGLIYWLGRAREAQGRADGHRQLRAGARGGHRVHGSERARQPTHRGTAAMSSQTAPITLADLQRRCGARLDRVPAELRRIVEADFGLIAEVNAHLFQMQGKMFRPTLLLLADEATGARDPRATTLAAVIELIHLATLVHDDSVDHSVLRRGMPTINSLFSHQVSVIMGDFLYSRASRARAAGRPRAAAGAEPRHQRDDGGRDAPAGGARPARVLRGAVRPPDPRQDRLAALGRLRGRALRAAPRSARRSGASARGSAWRSRSWTTCSTTPASGGHRQAVRLDLREHKVTLPLIAALPRMSRPERRRGALLDTPEPTTRRSPRSWRRSPTPAGWTTRGSGPSRWLSRRRRSWRASGRPRGTPSAPLAYVLDRRR